MGREDEAVQQRSSGLQAKLADGCHKYGWLISVVVQALLFAFMMGSMNQRIEDIGLYMGQRMERLETQVDKVLTQTRGPQ